MGHKARADGPAGHFRVIVASGVLGLVNTDLPNQDCDHRSCRWLARVVAMGRPVPKRCRKFCPAAASIVSLDQLGRGQTGRIVRVGGRSTARHRLLELGVVRGETITLQRAAPLGDPLEYIVKGYHLSLRSREAAQITVTVEPAAAAS